MPLTYFPFLCFLEILNLLDFILGFRPTESDHLVNAIERIMDTIVLLLRYILYKLYDFYYSSKLQSVWISQSLHATHRQELEHFCNTLTQQIVSN